VDGARLDDVIVKDVHPNLDVIGAGGRAKNAIQVLNSKEFEALLAELAKRYDRVVFDTPPLGAVSDALNMLPLMDGAIYTIQYDRVMRRAAQRCARRLVAANIPVFGAVLNDVRVRGTSDYYVEYHDKLVKKYYDRKGKGAVVTAKG
jgi:Mrp family chromosome partitioning ATPase